jgi:hypothetical protein
MLIIDWRLSRTKEIKKGHPSQCITTQAWHTTKKNRLASQHDASLTCYVPPVGLEPTLGTLLGGRPLPLGYGGFMRIPRTVQINARAADYYGLDSGSISPI